MKISLFYEFALPRPWQPDDEHVLLKDCLDEVEAAEEKVAEPTVDDIDVSIALRKLPPPKDALSH